MRLQKFCGTGSDCASIVVEEFQQISGFEEQQANIENEGNHRDTLRWYLSSLQSMWQYFQYFKLRTLEHMKGRASFKLQKLFGITCTGVVWGSPAENNQKRSCSYAALQHLLNRPSSSKSGQDENRIFVQYKMLSSQETRRKMTALQPVMKRP